MNLMSSEYIMGFIVDNCSNRILDRQLEIYLYEHRVNQFISDQNNLLSFYELFKNVERINLIDNRNCEPVLHDLGTTKKFSSLFTKETQFTLFNSRSISIH